MTGRQALNIVGSIPDSDDDDFVTNIHPAMDGARSTAGLLGAGPAPKRKRGRKPRS